MINRLVALSVGVFGVALLVSSAQAQGRAGSVSASGGRTAGAAPRSGTFRTNFARQHRGRRSFDGAFLPYFYPDYGYYDYDFEPGTIEAPPPQIIAPTPAAAPVAPAATPPAPLVLELRGDHWVRIENYNSSVGTQSSQPERAPNLKRGPSDVGSRPSQASQPSRELPPVVLVFRDGHKEEIEKYMIMGATICTGADYWSSGSWTRKIPIAELDVPATIKLNQEQGVKFTLPSGPSEVILR
jgi:hypothetical protein